MKSKEHKNVMNLIKLRSSNNTEITKNNKYDMLSFKNQWKSPLEKLIEEEEAQLISESKSKNIVKI